MTFNRIIIEVKINEQWNQGREKFDVTEILLIDQLDLSLIE